jgi:Uma2 family endonuclease
MDYSGQGIAENKAATPEWRERPYPVIPDSAIEIISPTDKYVDAEEKVEDYLTLGVRLIWLIDPQLRKVKVCNAAQASGITLEGDAVLTGGEVLPSFEIKLTDLFVQVAGAATTNVV